MHPSSLVRAAAAVLAVAAATTHLATPAPATAQDEPDAPEAPGAITWGVVPATADGPDGRAAFNYKLDPGAELVDHVAISNHSTEQLTLAVYASDAFTTTDGGFDLLPAAEPPVDAGSWITLDSAELAIPPRSRVHVPFQLTVPANATPGDHAGGIVASLTSQQPGGQVAVEHRVGARIYLRVTGELRPQLTVERIDARYAGTWNPFTGGALTATYTIRNTGNVRLTGSPAIEVAGPFGLGRREATGEPLPEILPGGTVTTTVRAAGAAPLFRLTTTATVRPSGVDGEVLDPAAPVAEARTRVWALPWSQSILLLSMSAGAAAGWCLRRRRRRVIAAQLATAREQGRTEALSTARPGASELLGKES
jgi:WxL interacting protein linking bacterial and host surfaces